MVSLHPMIRLSFLAPVPPLCAALAFGLSLAGLALGGNPALADESAKQEESAETEEGAKQDEGAETNETAADASAPLQEAVDLLDQARLQEAFRLLTREYIHHDQLDALEINRAALQGLLERLAFGAMLLTEEERSSRDSPHAFHRAEINAATAYLRFGRYNASEVEALDEALASFAGSDSLEHLVLDLRSPQATADFAIAAEILSRFRPPNELLFKIRRPGNERATLFVSSPVRSSWNKNLVILVDRDTGNVGEIIAAVLKRESECLIVGEATPGLTVEYRDVPLDEGLTLRFAIADVVLEDDSSLFQVGIAPDIETETPAEVKARVFRETEQGAELADFVYFKQRPRMNEAALVARTDPELDFWLLRSAKRPTPWDQPPPLDRVLLQAVDLLDTTRFLESGRRTRR